jgi:hypothetical protein
MRDGEAVWVLDLQSEDCNHRRTVSKRVSLLGVFFNQEPVKRTVMSEIEGLTAAER